MAVTPFQHRSTADELKSLVTFISNIGIAGKVLCVVADNASKMKSMVQKMKSIDMVSPSTRSCDLQR